MPFSPFIFFNKTIIINKYAVAFIFYGINKNQTSS